MITPNEIAAVGYVTKTHGIKGELTLVFDANFDFESCDYFVFDMDGIFVPFFIDEYRFKNDTTAFVTFDGISEECSAREFCGKTIYVKHELLNDDTAVSINYFVGFSVETNSEKLGTIDAIDDSTANPLLIIGDRLIPFNESFIRNIDSQKRILYMNLPEGLLDL
ncbi:MAG: 16S rRNA processing protein RimM [Sphingobacteriia bacterium]|jgi:16S rRNA processing protein RimM|nr:ribosome maturation factor RimM [Paludibacteraceae bacterium]NCA79015.1 16S rRNA processing protein RimM [Sphingobacteriia bacterium]